MSDILATIEKIHTIYPVEGADNIDMAVVMDYHVMVPKNDFKVGDLVIYVATSSIMPDGLSDEDKAKYNSNYNLIKKLKKIKDLTSLEKETLLSSEKELVEISARNTRPEFEFLRRKDFKIKALELKKFNIISEGIIFPLTILDKLDKTKFKIVEKENVTEILGIQKVSEDEVEEAADIPGKKHFILDRLLMKFAWYRTVRKHFIGDVVKGTWQSWFPSPSDEENIQKIFTNIKKNYPNEIWVVSEKMEGQSASFFIKKIKGLFNRTKNLFGVCSRRRYLKSPDTSNFWRSARIHDIENKLLSTGKELFIRGESCGPGIQDNIYGFSGLKLFLYDVMDIPTKQMYPYAEMKEFCEQYGFEMVPIISDNYTLPETVQELLDFSNGYSVFGDKVWREGLVFRSKTNPSVHFKCKSPKYKLIHGL